MAMPVFTAGRRLRASELKAMADQIDSLTAPGWTSYTPTYASAAGGAALGNGSAAGRWRRSANADTIIVRGKITFGTTTTYGTGALYCGLPVAPFNYGTPEVIVGSGRVQDVSVPQNWGVTAVVDDPNARVFLVGNAGIVTSTWVAFATGDNLSWFVEYQPA